MSEMQVRVEAENGTSGELPRVQGKVGAGEKGGRMSYNISGLGRKCPNVKCDEHCEYFGECSAVAAAMMEHTAECTTGMIYEGKGCVCKPAEAKTDQFKQDVCVHFYGLCAACSLRFRPVQDCKGCIHCEGD